MPEYGRRLDALQELLYNPRNLIERRVETFTLPSHTEYRWKIVQQVRIPGKPDATTQTGTYIVSLGMFEKKRTPDLEARDGAGNELAVLTRDARGSVMASALMGRYLDDTPYRIGDSECFFALTQVKRESGLPLSPAEQEMLRLVEYIADSIKCITTYGSENAQQKLDDLICDLQEEPHIGDGGWPELLREIDVTPPTEQGSQGVDTEGPERSKVTLEEQLTGFVGTVHVLAEVRAEPGTAVTVTMTFSDLIKYESPSPESLPTLGARLHQRWRRWFQRWGLLPATLVRQVHNADHSNSFYIVSHPPDGASIVRSYWKNVDWAKLDNDKKPYYSTMNESAGVVLSLHDDDAGAEEFPAEAWYDIQIRQETWLRLAWLQGLALMMLTALVWTNVIDGSVQNVAYVFGFPGGVLGALLLTTDSFSVQVSLALRRMFLAVAVLALGYGLGFSAEPSRLPLIGDWPLLKIYNATVAGYLVALVVVSGRTAFGRRTGKGEPSTSTTTEEDVATFKLAIERRVFVNAFVAFGLGLAVPCLYLAVSP